MPATKRPSWRKSSRSGTGNCVEVSLGGRMIRVRDTKDRGGGTLSFTCAEWAAFIEGVVLGEFDLPEPDRSQT